MKLHLYGVEISGEGGEAFGLPVKIIVETSEGSVSISFRLEENEDGIEDDTIAASLLWRGGDEEFDLNENEAGLISKYLRGEAEGKQLLSEERAIAFLSKLLGAELEDSASLEALFSSTLPDKYGVFDLIRVEKGGLYQAIDEQVERMFAYRFEAETEEAEVEFCFGFDSTDGCRKEAGLFFRVEEANLSFWR